MKMDFDFDAFFRGLDLTKVEVREGIEEGVHDATDHLLAVSRDIAPLKHGTLRLTAGKRVETSSTGVTGEVYYSATERSANGSIANYALITHELGESFKNPTTPGTTPKYLERPFKANSDRYKRMIADGVRRRLT